MKIEVCVREGGKGEKKMFCVTLFFFFERISVHVNFDGDA